MSAADYYSHSGRVPLRGLFFGLLAAFVAGPILAALYATAIRFIPFIYVNALLALAFGGAVGFGVARATSLGHVRNTFVTIALAGIGLLVSHYVGWIVWTAIVFRDAPLSQLVTLLFPPTLFEAVSEVARTGAWTFRGNPVKGGHLWFIWSAEALFVLGAGLLGAFVETGTRVYCEHCGRWCQHRPGVVRLLLEPTNDPALVERVSQRDFSTLPTVRRAEDADASFVSFDLSTCDGCGTTNTLNLARIRKSYDSKGNEKEESDPLVHGLLIGREHAEWLERFGASAS